MDVIQTGERLVVVMRRDFNLLTARKIARLADEAQEIHLDLTRSRLVNSEALIVLYKLIRAGKRVTLKNPPPILDEIIHILGLESVLNLAERSGGREA
jgi:hypothetical protein